MILLRVSDEQLKSAPIAELEAATSEAINFLIDEADRGIVPPATVVEQLESDEIESGKLFLYFYLRRLWHNEHSGHQIFTTGGLLGQFEDLMVELFAEYDRPLLLEFLREEHNYSLERASAVCERRNYIPELVYLLSKTGQTKRALFLIIDKLADVAQAIAFAKQQDDPDLWADLLDYSMDKPAFIRGLLENVGTAIDPITLVRRIPQGLAIDGLKAALGKILKEYGVQWSICDGVATALTSEVARGMDALRGGQRRGVKFCVAAPPATMPGAWDDAADADSAACGICRRGFSGGSGQCARPRDVPGCADVRTARKTLVAFACGHVFHLKCIAEPAAAADDADGDEDEVQSGYGRSVGAKVTRAALIGEKVHDGCSVCAKRKREEIMV